MRAFIIAALLLLTSCIDRRDAVTQAVDWFPRDQQATARCIVWAESSNDPATVGSAGEAGLFQVHPIHADEFHRLTGKPFHPFAWQPILNGQAALMVWQERGLARLVDASAVRGMSVHRGARALADLIDAFCARYGAEIESGMYADLRVDQARLTQLDERSDIGLRVARVEGSSPAALNRVAETSVPSGTGSPRRLSHPPQ